MLAQLIADYGYLAVFVGTFFEGETILVLGGFAAHRGYLDIKLVMLAAFVGTFLGDQLYYFIGRRWGIALLAKRPRWRDRSAKAMALLHKYDVIFILSFRFIYGVRSVSPFVIGMSGISPMRFMPLNLLAAFIWAIAVGLLGYFFGAVFERYMDEIKQYEFYILGGIAGIGLLFWGYNVLRGRRRKRAAAIQRAIDASKASAAPRDGGAGVEGVLKTVAQEVEGDDRQEDQQAGVDGQKGLLPDHLLGVGQHGAPAGDGRLDAEAKKA